MRVGIVKVRRCAMRTLPAAWGLFKGDLLNAGQFLTLVGAVITSYVGLQTKTLPQVIEEADSWVVAFNVFVYTAFFWAFVCLARAPFLVVKQEREKGAWHDGKRIYFKPELVAVVPFTADDRDKGATINFEDAEMDSFVSYSIELDPPVAGRASSYLESSPGMMDGIFASIGFRGRPNSLGTSRAGGRGGVRLKGKTACLRVKLDADTVPVYARVFMHSFEMHTAATAEVEIGG